MSLFSGKVKAKSVFKPIFNKEAYGSDWADLSEACKKRDNYTCRECGYKKGDRINKDFRYLHAHHIVPLPLGPNTLKNLMTLCDECHARKHPKNKYVLSQSRKNIKATKIKK